MKSLHSPYIKERAVNPLILSNSFFLRLCLTVSLTHRGIPGLMVSVVGNGHGDASSNPGQTVYTSHSTNALGKGMNPIIYLIDMGKQSGTLGSLDIVW